MAWRRAVSAAGRTTVTDPDQQSTKYDHDADGQVTRLTDALERSRSKKYDANRNAEEAADAMGVSGASGNVTKYGWDFRLLPGRRDWVSWDRGG
ncbi:RHS repeat domain-containing protein [Streptomyces sp. NPDC088719]|uniref:RHS repeat domain-containing protein n=1 Tax=Streptomyces sp. NPDC088719 TaxID=3365872 RepID=UPI003815D4F9